MEQTDPTYKPREDVKPLHILQPEGVSFKMDGHVLEWQKWKMHIGERLVLLVMVVSHAMSLDSFQPP